MFENGAIAIDKGIIVDIDNVAAIRSAWAAFRTIDCQGKLVSPGLIDAHTHLIHGGNRTDQNERRINNPDAIFENEPLLNTIEATRNAADVELIASAKHRLRTAMQHGTTTIEIKSGYGGGIGQELRLCQLINQVKAEISIDIVPTALVAHRPRASNVRERREALLQTVNGMPQLGELVSFCDVNFDPRGFSHDECEMIASTAKALNLQMRIHADQNGWAGGAKFAASINARSADHLDYIRESDAKALGTSGTVAILTPSLEFHNPWYVQKNSEAWRTLQERYELLSKYGVPVAIATDYNPGSAPGLSLQFAMQVAARSLRIPFSHLWYTVTLNAASSLGRDEITGSLAPGKRADIVVWNVVDPREPAEHFGYNLVSHVIAGGRLLFSSS